MQKNSLIIVLLLSAVTLSACKTTFTISFGSGGGFTGATSIYSFDNTGKLYKQEKLGSGLTAQPKELAKLKTKDVKAVKKLIAAVNFPTVHIDKPGNMSKFVNLTEGGHDYKTTWSESSSGNTSLDQLYEKLNSLIPKK